MDAFGAELDGEAVAAHLDSQLGSMELPSLYAPTSLLEYFSYDLQSFDVDGLPPGLRQCVFMDKTHAQPDDDDDKAFQPIDVDSFFEDDKLAKSARDSPTKPTGIGSNPETVQINEQDEAACETQTPCCSPQKKKKRRKASCTRFIIDEASASDDEEESDDETQMNEVSMAIIE